MTMEQIQISFLTLAPEAILLPKIILKLVADEGKRLGD